MMSARMNLLLALTLACILVCVSADTRNDKEEMEHDKDKKCCWGPIENSKSCCKVPELLPESTVQACNASMLKTSEEMKKGEVSSQASFGAQATLRGKSSPGKGFGWADLGTSDGPWGKMWKKWDNKNKQHGPGNQKEGTKESKGPRGQGGPHGGPGKPPGGPCFMDCVFKNHSLFNADGSLNVDKVTTLLQTNASATWAPVVKDAVTTCSDGVAGVKLPSPPSDAPKCNFTAGLFMKCFTRYLILACPADSANATDTTCPTKLAAVKACDPFAPPPVHKKGGPGSSEEEKSGSGKKSGSMQPSKQSAKKSAGKSGKKDGTSLSIEKYARRVISKK